VIDSHTVKDTGYTKQGKWKQYYCKVEDQDISLCGVWFMNKCTQLWKEAGVAFALYVTVCDKSKVNYSH